MAPFTTLIMRLRTFQGLVPVPQHAATVAAVPYDVVNREESAALAAGNPHSLLHVDRAEIDLPDEVSPYDDLVYAKAAENLAKLQADGILVRESEPCLYLYRQVMGEHAQTGLVGVCHIEDYENDIIRKHEKTRKVKEDDRTKLVDALSANTGPIFLTYRDQAEVLALTKAHETNDAPVHDFTAPDGIRHQVWKLPAETCRKITELFANDVPLSYVADGHHRSASAARVGKERREANPQHSGEENYNWFLCVLFPANELKILPYNRTVRDLNGHTPEGFLKVVGSIFKITPNGKKEPTEPGEACMYFAGEWLQLNWEAHANASPVDALDVEILQSRLLAPVLGIDDPRVSDRIDFIGGIRGVAELEKLVDSGKFAVAFSMYPTTVEQLIDIADAGQIMPPKSTWFEPKLRSGLFIHTLGDETK
jgi:uncharacterized protein (DUF1015 family)